MQEYDLVTAIDIRLLTQTRTCGMGSSSFSAMSQLKVAITTRSSFLIMPPTENTSEENVSVACVSDYRAYPYFDFSRKPEAYPYICACRCPHLQI